MLSEHEDNGGDRLCPTQYRAVWMRRGSQPAISPPGSPKATWPASVRSNRSRPRSRVARKSLPNSFGGRCHSGSRPAAAPRPGSRGFPCCFRRQARWPLGQCPDRRSARPEPRSRPTPSAGRGRAGSSLPPAVRAAEPLLAPSARDRREDPIAMLVFADPLLGRPISRDRHLQAFGREPTPPRGRRPGIARRRDPARYLDVDRRRRCHRRCQGPGRRPAALRR